MKPNKQRLDLALVERGLTDSRTKAQSLIMARRVRVNGEHATKPGVTVRAADAVSIDALEHPWVGRGGMKLAHALEHFGISVAGLTCADIGASTGGFTHVMLEAGAKRVYAIDVGYGQLDASLRSDPRVVNRERVNARALEASDFEEPIELVSIDVSFISLTLILPAVVKMFPGGGRVVALIKPQFEVGRHDVGKRGIVRDEAKRTAAVERISGFASSLGFKVAGIIESPIHGAEGNIEYLMCATLDPPTPAPEPEPGLFDR